MMDSTDIAVTAKFKATIVATDGTDTVALTKTGLIPNVLAQLPNWHCN